MQIQATSVEEYLEKAPDERKAALLKLREVILENLPEGFEEVMSYGMPAYVVPHSIFPAGYHCKPEEPLPFLSFASQKNFVGLYHMGIYVDDELLNWFTAEYPKHMKTKLDMGKSCIRFKNIKKIPYDLIGQLASKMTVDRWIQLYEQSRKG